MISWHGCSVPGGLGLNRMVRGLMPSAGKELTDLHVYLIINCVFVSKLINWTFYSE
jgi:hypothetical protein